MAVQGDQKTEALKKFVVISKNHNEVIINGVL